MEIKMKLQIKRVHKAKAFKYIVYGIKDNDGKKAKEI